MHRSINGALSENLSVRDGAHSTINAVAVASSNIMNLLTNAALSLETL
jgi:hypothetical protein